MSPGEIEDLKEQLNVGDDFMQEVINALDPYVPTTNLPSTGSGSGSGSGSGGSSNTGWGSLGSNTQTQVLSRW